ncbi:DUF2199 domain-containing protein [Streptomyces sp. NPDC057302]|uniref:DUF2199 domain-containing protein n=1 Tax=Streptomyces sp. NPDC057302 TaxID=3346094 RepID=UPI00362715C5
MSPPPCACCSGELDVSDPRFDLELPQPVLEMDGEDYRRHVRFASDAVVITDNIGGFARALLPIGLVDGRTTTIGVWVSLDPEVFRHFMAVGSGKLPFDQMQFEGRLASELDPWGSRLLRLPLLAGVDVPTYGKRRTPHIKSSPDPLLTEILSRRWPAAEVLTGGMAWAVEYDRNTPGPPQRHNH